MAKKRSDLCSAWRLPGHGTRPGKRHCSPLWALSYRPCRLASRSNLPHSPMVPEGGWNVHRGGRKRQYWEEEKRRAEMQEACRGMDDLAKKLGAWDPVKVIRRARDARRPAA